MRIISSEEFKSVFLNVVSKDEAKLLDCREETTRFTKCINDALPIIATEFDLKFIRERYKIDEVFYEKKTLTDNFL